MRTRILTLTAVAGVGLALVALPVLPALPASAKGLSQSQIKNLENELNKGKKVTYSATYVSSDSTSVTIAQQKGKSNFTASDGSSVINTGSKTYYCSKSGSGNSGSSGNSGNSGNSGGATTTTTKAGGSLQCLTESGTNPLLGLEDAFSPTILLSVLNEDKAAAVARAYGIKITTSSQKFAGQNATCLSATVQGKSGKYCVLSQGILAYVGGSGGSTFKMTKFSTKPASSLFQLPSGATTVTIPSVPNVSIPDVSIPDVSIPSGG